jgi:hypothetical protein
MIRRIGREASCLSTIADIIGWGVAGRLPL